MPMPLLHWHCCHCCGFFDNQRCRCNDSKDTSVASLIAMLPLLLATLPSLHSHQCPHYIGVIAIITLASLIAKESATRAKMPVQQGHWRGCKDSKDTSNGGNTTGSNQLVQQRTRWWTR
jgi:hypothetical protein